MRSVSTRSTSLSIELWEVLPMQRMGCNQSPGPEGVLRPCGLVAHRDVVVPPPSPRGELEAENFDPSGLEIMHRQSRPAPARADPA